MVAPVSRLKKTEIIWLNTHSCEAHGHRYLDHYNCYLKENPFNKRLGFLDIETYGLDADFGVILSYCILDAKTGKIYHRVINKKELHTCMDKDLMIQFVKDLKKFDIVVGYYSTRFDIPYLRTRALVNNVAFPNFGEINHIDVYYAIRNRFKLSRNRQENACRVLLGKTEKTRVESKHWIRAIQGNEKSINYILDHNKRDVRDLQRLYEKVVNYTRRTDRSI